ncbi:MAG: SCO family protein [Hyphomicrobiaceae bacterium]
MSMRSFLTTAAAAAVVIAAMTGLTLYFTGAFNSGTGYRSLVGGHFVMSTQDGRQLTDLDLKGKPFAIFFGFTQCPDVCPTTMLEVANIMNKLGPDADKMKFLFVSVDPERDTPAILKQYLASFDERIIGLVGTPEQTANIVRAYRVYFAKVPTKESYTINHTATVFLMDATGHLAKTISFSEDEKTKLAKIRGLLRDAPLASTH